MVRPRVAVSKRISAISCGEDGATGMFSILHVNCDPQENRNGKIARAPLYNVNLAETVCSVPRRRRSSNRANLTMNFEFTPEQIQLRKSVRDFAEAEIAPHVLEWDENQTFPLEVIKKAGELGIMGAIFPEELGGAGFGYIDYSIVIEELARVDPSVALIVAAHNSLCSNHIYLAGNKEQQCRYIPKLATGEWIGCWSLTEPEAGSDAAGTRSTATLRDGRWVLNGGKTFTTNAQYADVCVAMAVTDRSASQHGISAFILEKGTPGFRVGKKENKLGMRASATGEVLFTDCSLPQSQLLGKPGEGFVDSLRILDGGRISIAALSVGLAQGAFEAALKYSKRRKQFGRFISEFQSIQHMLSDMATSIESARWLTYCAGARKDAGKRVTKESAMAKLFASEVAVKVADKALQIHGGYGFIKDYPVEKFYRDVKLCTIGEGTSEIQRMVIARQLLKE
jgi:alkylation response protein AidB-like acyl-CoA dehydrogenase